MRAVLTLYLWRFLGFEKDTATAFYHGFIVLCYCAPVLGAIIADSCLGKFTTIISLSIVYAIGNIAVSLAAIPPVFNYSLDGERAMTFVGLILIALGTGGIKPCVSAFGGDQFKEEQKSLLPKFFSIFYFSINAGSLISTFLTPIFRADVQCFGQDCYALAFGIPAGLMIVSLIIFIIGSPLYIKHRPQCGKFWELVIFKFLISSILIVYKGIVMCVKVTVGKVTGRVLWKPSSSIYQTAEAKYGDGFVSDVKDVLKVLVMFLPLPIFWALFDQQGSRWTLQATQMNGEIAGGFRIQPDQVQTLNPLLILVFIPLFEVVVYPLLAKCKLLTRPLQRMVTGMTLASLSFVVAALVQIYIDQSLDVIPQGQGRLSFANPTNISMTVESVDGQPLNWTLGYHDFRPYNSLPVGNHTVCIRQEGDTSCDKHVISLGNEEAVSLVMAREQQPIEVKGHFIEDIGDNITLRIVNTLEMSLDSFQLTPEGTDPSLKEFSVNFGNISTMGYTQYRSVKLIDYSYSLNFSGNLADQIGEFKAKDNNLHAGGGYTLVLVPNQNGKETQVAFFLIQDISPNSVHIALQIPMYVLITAGEIMFSVTGLDFAYSQAPQSMKSIIQAAWLLTVAGGNILVIIIAEGRFFPQQFVEFFFFAGLIFFLAVVFAFMSCAYTYRDDRKKKSGGDSPNPGDSPRSSREEDEKHPLLDGTVSDNNGISEMEESFAGADRNIGSDM